MNEEDKEQQKKLKDLETSLARELDQQVKLSEPTDALMTGGIELNPSLNLGKAEDAVPKPNVVNSAPPKSPLEVGLDPLQTAAKKKDEIPVSLPEEPAPKPAVEGEEISLEDLDALLQQESPELQKEIDTLRKAGEDASVANADLSKFDVDAAAAEKEVAEADGLPTAGPKPPLLQRIKLGFRGLVHRSFNGVMDFLYQAPPKYFRYLVRFFKEDLKGNLIGLLHKMSSWLDKNIEAFKELKWTSKLLLLGMVLLPAVAAFLIFGNLDLSQIGSTGLHQSFKESFGEELPFDNKQKFVPLSDEAEFPQHVVLLERIVVNLRPSNNSGPNPMAAARLYFEITTRDGAIEVKDREKEMRDLSQRVMETYTYDQMVSADGKKSFKDLLRREMTSSLNNGTVKNVFIDDILLKP